MDRDLKVVVVGVSTGGVMALKALLGALPANFQLPIVVVQHISPEAGDGLARLLDELCSIRVKEANEQEAILPATAYIAPANYHLLLESGGFFSLSADSHVSYARPSVDVLFMSAAEAFGPGVVGVILTGANFDGSAGLHKIKSLGGVAVVQDPADAEAPQMPQAALTATKVDFVVPLAGIAPLLCKLTDMPANSSRSRTTGEHNA